MCCLPVLLFTRVVIYPCCYVVVMLQYVMEDLRSRVDLAFSWLYQEYANCQGFNVAIPVGEKANMASYDECLTSLLQGIMEGPDHRDGHVTICKISFCFVNSASLILT